ncbi:hypothetical protein SY2F82_28380 [Streptomyces sp. Y2F8-2]|uniref:hypothetical protein n=1 Tax=Streptomyces sp. Y2F8-2 TaxID=2759675 RepID=UPI001907BF71|nr:hypothetical protein [Streptomyces sp. Y2F8-2]GHK01041.1 hypothetical protein SY2F82_28380 [Streptomyces sp. Y2F8-2]
MISPSGIPQFTGDFDQLDRDVSALRSDAVGIRNGGMDVHSRFQMLQAFYTAPEADDLFATTQPVLDKADAFAAKLETVADALDTFSIEARPLAKRLEQLKADALAFVASVDGDDKWTEDEDKVHRNKQLVDDVTATQFAFQEAERRAAGKISKLVGGPAFVADHGSGSHDRNTVVYGYDLGLLEGAKELPWGSVDEQSYEAWSLGWFGHGAKTFVWDGIYHDGIEAGVSGLWTLVGGNGSDAAGDAWSGLKDVVTGIGLYTASPYDAAMDWAFGPAKESADEIRAKKAAKEFGKSLVAWDQWQENPTRAAGTTVFNVLTLGAGPLAVVSKTSEVGAVAKSASVAAKVGEFMDPVSVGLKATGKAVSTMPKLSEVTAKIFTGADSSADAQRVHSVIELDDGSKVVIENGEFIAYDKHGDVVGNALKQERHVPSEATPEQAPVHEPEFARVSATSNTPEATGHVGDNSSPQAGHEAASAGEAPSGHSRDITDGTSTAHSHSSMSGGGGGDAGGPPLGGSSHLPDGPMEPRGNLPDGSWEGPQGLRLSPEENAATDQFMDRAQGTEPRITEAIQAATGHVEQGKLNGLEYRLKGEDSLKRKVATALLEDARLTPERALANIRDSLRYTVEIPTRDYSHGVQRAVDELRARGFENVTFKNTWGNSGYKGINSTWRDPSTGQIFEVQFHTPESFTAKMDTHVLYEKGRLPGISREEFEAIQSAQNDLFDRVPVPHGADSIQLDHDLRGSGAADAPDVHTGQHGDESVHGNGPPPELTPEQRAAHDAHLNDLSQRYSDDFDHLKQDPDHKGKVKPSEMDEARVALDLRENGKVPTDIQRPPGANQGDLYSPSTGEFYDIKGVHSDWPPLNNVRDKSLPFKAAYNPANNQGWVRKLEDQIVTKGRMVILDMRNANQAAIDDVKSIVEQHGWSDRVVWYP